MKNVTELELKQHVGKSEEQIIQTAFSKLQLQLEPDKKIFDVIINKLKAENAAPVEVVPIPKKKPILMTISDIVPTFTNKPSNTNDVNVTPSPYARYIDRFSSKAVKTGVGSVCAGVLLLGSMYGITMYKRSPTYNQNQQVVVNNETNNTSLDTLLLEGDSSLDNDLAVIESGTADSVTLSALIQGDSTNINSYADSLY